MKSASMWVRLGEWILSHPRPILTLTAALTLFLAYFAAQVKTDHTAGQFLSADSPEVIDARRASSMFGQTQAILYLAFRDADPVDPTFLRELDAMVREVSAYEGVDNVLALTNVPFLTRSGSEITPQRLYRTDMSQGELEKRFNEQPFLRGSLLSEDGTTPLLTISIDEEFNNRPERVDLVERIRDRAQQVDTDIAMAGFPYLRTRYAQRITAEAPLFAAMAMAVSLLLLFIAFRDWRALMLPALVVVLGITWTIGLISLFDHRLNIVTSILPALFVIIGMATTVHLCTSYYDQFGRLGDRRAALVQTIGTVGISTFLACLTTAVGFAVLVVSGSALLAVFGVFASIGIMMMYVLALTLIPLSYLHLRPPSKRKSALI